MGLHLIIGRAGTGKTYRCIQEIQEEIKLDPLGQSLIFCVPEQSTHQMELSLIHGSESQGILRAQVLSFQRLGWRVFAEAGGGLEPLIGDIGKRMILRRLLLKHRQELRIFARTATRPGMADLLARTIGEFKTYQVDSQDLLIEDDDKQLVEKIHELAFLYEEFNRSIPPNMRDRDEELDLVAEKIPAATSLQGAKVWLDGFKGFTPQELSIIEALLKTTADVTITLTLEPEVLKGKRSGSFRPGEEIFWDSYQTYQALVKIAQTHKIAIDTVNLTKVYRFQNPALEHLEKYYTVYPTQIYSDNHQEDPGIKLIAGANKRAEVEAVACAIRRLVREKGKRWRDIVVATRDLVGYEDYLGQVFKTYEIPYFLDHKPQIKHHPLLELLNSLIEVAQLNWAYEPLFRCLKTGFFPFESDLVDRLENYCLAYGINHKDWSQDKVWAYRYKETEEELAQLNDARYRIHSLLEPFVKTLRKNIHKTEGSIPVKRIIADLYQLLIDLQVPEQLKVWGEEAIEREELAEAQLQSQIWEAMIEVFDEMVLGLGEEILKLEEFLLIFTSGLENLQLGLIPPAVDQVLVGSLERSRNPETSYLFLIGANEGILPGNPPQEGVFDEEEREHLAKKGISLAPKGKGKLYEEYYFIYMALTRGKEGLFVSYSLTDESGKGLTVSTVVQRLKTIFPLLKEEYVLQGKKEFEDLEHPNALLEPFALELQNWGKGIPLTPLWKIVRRWYQENQEKYPQVNLLESSLESQNSEPPIPKKLTQQLYGKRLLTSVTRMEQFARCPFAHFVQYGLRLKERDHFRLSFPDIGQFFHQVLHDVAVEIQEKQLNWGELSNDESWQLVNERAELISTNFQNKLLLRNARYQYLTRKLKRAVHHAVKVLGEHARQGVFTPLQLEVQFGSEGILPPLEVDLDHGNTLLIRGQIDRVDATILDGHVYLRIFDYKSRISQVNLNQIYHGLDLQLLVYLEAALQGASLLTSPLVLMENQGEMPINVHPAGILYFPVFEPFIESKSILRPEEVQREQIKAVKVKGFLLSDKQVLEAMDQSFASGASSLLGIRLLKSGDFAKKGSPVLTEDQFSLLRQYLYSYLQDCGKNLLEGNISIAPYKLGKETGCQYCSFKPVCHFDLYLPENTYRTLPFIKDNDFWGKVQEVVRKEEEEKGETSKEASEESRNQGNKVVSDEQKNKTLGSSNYEDFWLGDMEEKEDQNLE